jgi:hypothetical protein
MFQFSFLVLVFLLVFLDAKLCSSSGKQATFPKNWAFSSFFSSFASCLGSFRFGQLHFFIFFD